jgi:hypothetical protein
MGVLDPELSLVAESLTLFLMIRLPMAILTFDVAVFGDLAASAPEESVLDSAAEGATLRPQVLFVVATHGRIDCMMAYYSPHKMSSSEVCASESGEKAVMGTTRMSLVGQK